MIRGPDVFAGYWREPELPAAALKDGWLHTGDLARMDQHGYIYIVDRKKEMIVSGGFNVYPSEIEQALVPPRRGLRDLRGRRARHRCGARR